jgi:hypothetical protein
MSARYILPARYKHQTKSPVLPTERGVKDIYSNTRTGLRAILHGIKGAEGNKEAAPITMFLRTK